MLSANCFTNEFRIGDGTWLNTSIPSNGQLGNIPRRQRLESKKNACGHADYGESMEHRRVL